MYSQCPDCQTRFRVTADVLRAAHGTVRCGRCGSAFDALERLTDTLAPAAPRERPVPVLIAQAEPTALEAEAEIEYHFSAEDLERVFEEGSDWRDALAAPSQELQASLAPAGNEPAVLLVDENAGIEDITLEGERIRIEAPAEHDEAVELEIDALAGELREQRVASAEPEVAATEAAIEPAQPVEAIEPVEPIEPIEPPLAAAAADTAAPVTAAPDAAATPPWSAAPEPPAEPIPMPLSAQRWRRPAVEREPEEAEPQPRAWASGALAWSAGGFVLAVALLAQVVDHFRQDLVRHPQLGPPLRATYERLGVDLLPNWDLDAFELRQWGNDAGAAAQGRMAVRASLTNRARFAQPHPILRLELEDRFGATVATRDFEPADYLKNPSQAERLIAPGASSEAELLLADTGPEAVGYRLDVCLRESATVLRCALGPD